MNRRDFLKNLGVIGCSVALLGQYELLADVNTESDFSTQGYKALVCIRLLGGNDSINMLVDKSNFEEYKGARNSVFIKEEELLNLNEGQFGIHPTLGNLQKMYDNEELAFVANVGTLNEIITQENFKSAAKPDHLFSHNSQQNLWDALDDEMKTGWAGRISDEYDLHGNVSGVQIPMMYGVDTYPLLVKTTKTPAYRFTTSGTISFHAYNNEPLLKQAYFDLKKQNAYKHHLTDSFADVTEYTITKTDAINQVLEQNEVSDGLFSTNNNLSKQLKLVLNMIKTHMSIGLERQVFCISLGGFDTHQNQKYQQKKLFALLNTALEEFNEALKVEDFHNNVTTFITSDFGRSVTSNGDGTDHGWGGHYFVMGGDVKGGKVYGEMPSLNINSEIDFPLTSHKRLIPNYSVEEYLAPICQWYGLNDESLKSIFPNWKNFLVQKRVPLNFMKDTEVINPNA